MTDPTDRPLLSIGEFGRLSQLSRKALRLYAERNLLTPTVIDPDSGYRYYQRAQVVTARRIRLLRLAAMPLDGIAQVLAVWDVDPLTAQRLIHGHISRAEQQWAQVQVAARLLQQELTPDQEHTMTFTFTEADIPAQMVVSIRHHITVPAYHQSIMPTLQQLWAYIEQHGARPTGDPVALYYGPVNEEDDGPVEICVPFSGLVPPSDAIKVRELPAHKAVQVRTYGEYNQYPKLLEMWNALARYVQDHELEANWDHDMTTYEIWHADETMTIGWPVRDFVRLLA